MAVARRGGHVDGVIFHSDRGCQYTSSEFAQLCEAHHVVQSMGATGICWDNAAAESFFATLKRELVHRHAWATRADAKRAIVRWIEGWYNPRRCTPRSTTRPPTRRRTHGTLLTVKSRNDLSVEAGQLQPRTARACVGPFRKPSRRTVIQHCDSCRNLSPDGE